MDLINTIRNIGFGALITGGISGSSVSLAEERLCYELLDGTKICTQDLVGSPGVAPDAQVAYPAPTAINSPQSPSSPRGKVLEAEHKIASPSILPPLSSPTPEASPKVSPAKIVKRQPSPLERVVAAYTPEIKEYRGIAEEMSPRREWRRVVGIFDRVMSSVSDKGKYRLDEEERNNIAIFLAHAVSSGAPDSLEAITDAEKELQTSFLAQYSTQGTVGSPTSSSNVVSLLEEVALDQIKPYWEELLKRFGVEAASLFQEFKEKYKDNHIAEWKIAQKMVELSRNHKRDYQWINAECDKYNEWVSSECGFWSTIEVGFDDFTASDVVEALNFYKDAEWPLYRTALNTLLSTAAAVSSAYATSPHDEEISPVPAVSAVASCLSSYKKQGNHTGTVVDSLSTIASAPYSPRGFKDAPMKVKAIYDAALCLEMEREKPNAGTFASWLRIAIEDGNMYQSFFLELKARCPKKENAQKGSRPEIKEKF